MVCEWFGLKTTRTIFASLASKLVATVSSGLTSKFVVTVFASLASKLVATVFPGLSSKSVVGSWLSLKTKVVEGFPVWALKPVALVW
jgi:O-succinylbenzoate synthase